MALPAPADAGPAQPRSDWTTLRKLLPYLWRYRWRVGVALAFLVAAKVANVGVPLLLKQLVDDLSIKPGDTAALLVVPVGLIVAYGALRLSTSFFTELRELIFAKATEGTARSISLQVFRHLHALSLRFHLERQTGGMTRDIERGTRAVHSLISYSLYSILPTLIEVTLVLTLLAVKFDVWFAGITIIALVLYISFTVAMTEWRTQFRKQMNELDSTAHSRAIDSLLNYETVKYFNNEDFEARRYDENLERLRRASLKSQSTLSVLNTGQQTIIAVALVAMLWRATARCGRGPADAGRPGDDQRLHDPAVHPAELPGRDLPRDQAEPDRPGQDVHAAGARPRGGRRTRRERAAGQRRRGALRTRELRLRPGAAHPARRELRDPRRQDGGGGGAVGRRQVARWRGCCTASMT
jgi:ABC-type bacteriocin/lantibiotic exporter with double-glycine peptidase domain